MDIIDQIMEYETGNMTEAAMFELFQELVDTGMAWKLQGHYGRVARNLIDAGIIREKSVQKKS